MVIELKSLKETELFAKKVSKILEQNELLLLFGGLGSGKTTFVKYLLRVLKFKKCEVSSPSFTIVQEYNNSFKKVYHIDLYRIENESELLEIGLEEILNENDLILVEWPEIGMKIFEKCGKKIIKIKFTWEKGKRFVELTN